MEIDQEVALGRRCWTSCLALGPNILHGGILQPPRDARHGTSGPVSGEIWNYPENVADYMAKEGDMDLDFDAAAQRVPLQEPSIFIILGISYRSLFH
eukprot:6217431-Amphidinium_carterae.1